MEVIIECACSVVAKILEYPVGLIGRHLGYLVYYRANKENLTNRVPELDNKISSVQHRVQAARRNGEELEEYVTGWIREAERKVQEAKDVIDDRGHENAKCSCNGSFPNLVSRYKLSKKAKIMAEKIVIDLQKADGFGNFSYRPLIRPSFKNKDYEAFDTRNQTLKEIMEALRDPNLTMIGVYGMGGIGKTTLVNEVAHQAKKEECFSELVMVTVSQEFDLKSIQQGIAEGLGLELKEEDMSARATRLQHRLRQGNKILIILDDIWNELDLSKAGIDFNADDQKGCKILLVSRDRDVLCSLMDVRKIIEVKVLSDREPEGLFNKFVGDKADNSDFKELVNQVVGECGGLPIAIVTIARSLKNKDILFWKDFLYRLKSSRGMEGKVYTSIKMSYDVLQSEEEKKLLLLCSLHGEDANIRVNDLMFYGIGLDLFQGVHTMDQARCRAHSLVDKLKAHCLLLDGGYAGTVKMHDVIRDVMISIAKEDEHMHCLTKVAELEDGDFTESKAIVLVGPDFKNQLLPSLVCPKLQLLLAHGARYPYLSLGSIPADFVKEAQELKALCFYREPLQSLPQSFCTLRHLRALRLRLGKNEDLTLIGELRNLIVLDLSWSTFSQLPEHIGKLKRLRSLNLSYCSNLSVIQPNVISSLVRLEELYMDQVNIDWEVEGRVGEGRNASLMEVKNLRNLTALHLNVRDVNVLPKDMFGENLQRFRIMIGRCPFTIPFTGSRLLYLNLRESSQLYQCGIQKLMKESEWMRLEEFHGVDNIVYELEIYSFPQLRELSVSSCPNLKYLFTVAVAGKLPQLETLEIRGCPDMEEVVVTNEHREGRLEKILFPKLKSLELKDLPNLKRFCTGDCIECPSLLKLEIKNCRVLRKFISSNEEEVEGPFFNEKVSFPILEELQLSRMNLKILWADQLSITSFGMQNLKMLCVSDCDSLSRLFSLDVARSLLQLEKLELWGCKDTEEVLVTKEPIEEGTPIKIFPKLKNLKLWNLQNIRRFCAGCCIEFPSLTNMTIYGRNTAMITDSCNGASGELMGFEARQPFFNGKVAFPKLEELKVRGLNSVNSLFSFAVAKSLVTLKKLDVLGCNLMEEIVQVNEEGRLDEISFPKLERISLSLSNLKRFFEKSEELMGSEAKQPLFNGKVAFPKLEELCVSGLNSVNSLFSFAAAESLVTLEKLHVSDCNLMEEIVQVNEQGRLDKISFPKLEIISLRGLSNLKRFYEKSEELMGSESKQPLFNGTVAFPKLEELYVGGLNSVNSLFSFATAESLVTLEKLHVSDCNLMEEIVQVNEQGRLDKISFPKLEIISLRGLSNLKRFYEKSEELMGSESKQPLFNGTVAFPKLEELYVGGLNSVNSLFSFAAAESLVTLEKLHVSDCNLMEEIVQVNEQGRLDKISFPKLEIISLRGLSNLKRFYEKSEELMGSESKQPLFNGTVAFPKLEALSVDGLNSVNSLFSFAVAKSLVTLKKLEVRRCSLMDEIVQVNEQGRLDKISFPKLESIEFYGLSNLKRFYGGACIEFPSLLKLEITDKETKERMDIVVAEQHLVFNEVLGPNLEELTTNWSELIKEMCNCQSSRAPPFCNLKVVVLICLGNEPIGFSLKCIQRYQNLESLFLVGFFVDTTHHHQQLMVSSEEHERPLKHLKKLRLFRLFLLTHLHEDSEDSENSSLENLKFLLIQECSILKSPLLSSTTSFQNLMALVVSKCSAMINLLASSTAKTLVHLRLMSITECKQMTEIIAGEIVDVEIVFGKLEFLELSDLPSLRSFHSAGNSVMRFPNLVMLIVSQCPEMQRFSSGTIDAPKLDSIISKIEKNEYQWNWLIDESDLDDESKFDDKMLTRLPKPQQKLWEGDINKTLEKLWEEDDYSLAMQRLFTDT